MKKYLLAAIVGGTIGLIASCAKADYKSEGKFYIKSNVGASKLSKIDHIKSKNSNFLDLGIGYNIKDNVRVDLTFSKTLDQKHEKSNIPDIVVKSEINTLLLNGFLDVVTFDKLNLFIGYGIGVSHTKSNVTYSGYKLSKHKNKPKYDIALAGYLGSSYAFSPDINLELNYSYRVKGKSHKVETMDGLSISYEGHYIGSGIRFNL